MYFADSRKNITQVSFLFQFLPENIKIKKLNNKYYKKKYFIKKKQRIDVSDVL